MLSIVDGWCVFDGRRTAFSFPFPHRGDLWRRERTICARFEVDGEDCQAILRPFDFREAKILDGRTMPPPFVVEYVVYPPIRPTREALKSQGLRVALSALAAIAFTVFALRASYLDLWSTIWWAILGLAPSAAWFTWEIKRSRKLFQLQERSFADEIARLPPPPR